MSFFFPLVIHCVFFSKKFYQPLVILNALLLHEHLKYRKSSIRSRPLIQVASIRGRTIGGAVQPLIVGKILNPSKLPYLDHFELFEGKNLALEFIFIEIPLIQV